MPKMQNRVQETTTTGGTGTITLAGAVTGYITFAAGFTTGDVLFYTIDNGIGEWEIGIGTLVTTGTLSRTTVIASSNSGALVNFSSGTKRVFCSAPTRSLVPDQDSKSGYVLTTDGTNPSWTQTLNSVNIGNTTAGTGAFTTLSASSTVSGTGFSNYLASPPAIGGTAAAAGNFTTLTTSSTVTLNGGTANGVGYLNASKVLTTGTALVFDGTNLGIGLGGGSPQFKLNSVQGITSAAPSVTSAIQVYAKGYGGAGQQYAGIGFAMHEHTNGYWGSGILARDDSGSYGSALSFYVSTGSATPTPTEAMRISSSGNLGLGVTPSAWAPYRAFQLGLSGAIFGDAGSRNVFVSNNLYYTGSQFAYLLTGPASYYHQANTGQHGWYTAPSGTAGSAISFGDPKMTLTAAGDLGIGTASPVGKLNIGDGDLRLTQTAGGDASGVNSYSMYFRTPSGDLAQLYCTTEGGGGPSGFGGALRIFTKPNNGSLTERARITSAGDLLVGTTSALATEGFTVVRPTGVNPVGAIRNSNATAGKYWIYGPNNSNNYILYNNGATGVYLLDGGTSWSSSSDERKKDIIEPISNAAEKVASLRAVIGKYKNDNDGVRRAFLIAQDVQAVLPEAVSQDENGMLGLAYTDTIPLLAAAIQELSARLETLENKVN